MATVRTEKLPVETSEDVVRVRQAVRAWAVELGFSLVDQTKIVTAASELARNTVVYGGGGTCELESLQADDRRGLAPDLRGPGPGHRRHRAGAAGRLHHAATGSASAWAAPSGSRTSSRSGRSRARAPACRSRGGSERTADRRPRVEQSSQVGRGPPRGCRPCVARCDFDETDGGPAGPGGHRAGDQPRQARAAGARSCCGRSTRRRPASWRCSRSTAARAWPTSPAACEDGYSTAGSPGTGLGRDAAPRRPASTSGPGPDGTAWLVRIEIAPAGARRRARRFQIGGVCRARAGRGRVRRCLGRRAPAPAAPPCSSPTAWAMARTPRRPRARPSRAFRRAAAGALPVPRGGGCIDLALRRTRGAAVAVAAHRCRRRSIVRFAGVGNIAAAIHGGDAVRHLVSHNGTVGVGTRRIEEFTYPWAEHAVLVMHSDGITARDDLAAYPGLLERHPGLVAGVLYRDFARGRDDVTVVVARRHAAREDRDRDGRACVREHDVVVARQRARQIAELLGFDRQDQTRIATAVSEIARNAFRYAGGGRVEFAVEGQTPPQVLLVRVSRRGAGDREPAERAGRPVPLDHRHGPRHHRRAPADGRVRHRVGARPRHHRLAAQAAAAAQPAGQPGQRRRAGGRRWPATAPTTRWPRCASRTRSCCRRSTSCAAARTSWSSSTASWRTPTAAWSRSTPSSTRRPTTCGAPTR